MHEDVGKKKKGKNTKGKGKQANVYPRLLSSFAFKFQFNYFNWKSVTIKSLKNQKHHHLVVVILIKIERDSFGGYFF